MPKVGGRTKGTPNKSALPLQEKAKELGCDPFEILCRFALGDWQGLGYDKGITYQSTNKGDLIEKHIIPPELRSKAAAEAAQYLYPKRKAIEHSGEVTNVVEEKLSTKEIETILRSDLFLNTGKQ
jgi:hypothetical protein